MTTKTSEAETEAAELEMARAGAGARIIYLTGPELDADRAIQDKQAEAYGEAAREMMNDGMSVVICGPTHWWQYGLKSRRADNKTDAANEQILHSIMDSADEMVVLELPGWRRCESLKKQQAWAEGREIPIKRVTIGDLGLRGETAAKVLSRAGIGATSNQIVPGLKEETRAVYSAEVATQAGKLTIELDTINAPAASGSFIHLAEHEYYNGLPFHCVVKDLLAQTGCTNGDGTGDAGYHYGVETGKLKIAHGSVVMVKTEGGNSAQWFIVLGREANIGEGYTVFGTVTDGKETLERMNDWPVGDEEGPEPYRPTEPLTIEGVKLSHEWKRAFDKSGPDAKKAGTSRPSKRS